MAGSKFQSIALRTQTRHPFPRHAKRPPRGIFFAQVVKARALPDWKVLTRLVNFLLNHNNESHSRSAIRILRSNCIFCSAACLPLPPIIHSFPKGVCSKTTQEGTQIDG